MPGSACARPPRVSASTESTLPVPPSCSQARPAISSWRPKVKYLEVCIFLGRRLEDGQVHTSAKPRKPSSRTWCASRTGMRSNRPSPTGCSKPTTCRTRCRRAAPQQNAEARSNRKALKDRHGAAPLHYGCPRLWKNHPQRGAGKDTGLPSFGYQRLLLATGRSAVPHQTAHERASEPG